jgi:hypothetical protein
MHPLKQRVARKHGAGQHRLSQRGLNSELRWIVFFVGMSIVGASAGLADDAEFWSLTKPERPSVPDVSVLDDGDQVRNPIDAFIFRALQERGLAPAPTADRQTLVRRAHYDLLGLPPTPEQVEKFMGDTADDAWPRLVDELLASPHYGERWGRHWLDIARYADSGGYETDIYYRNAWRYRDYVVKSFNDDKPYDRFVQEQIAGDELWPDNLDLDPKRVYQVSPEKQRNLEARTGTGLYALGPQIHESGLDAAKLKYETLTDWVDTTGAVFLGMTVGCARCHDHKFDPISQHDYYALQAAFVGSVETEVPLFTAMEIADWKQSYPHVVAVDEARRAYRLFEQSTAGRELTPAEEEQKKQLLADIGSAVLAVPERAGSAPNSPYDGLMEIPTVSVLGHERPELVKPVHILQRGNLGQPGEQVEAALPAVFAAATGTDAHLPGPVGSRKQLSLWLTQPDHPLTARVMVNRIWHWHFGRGIVATPNDFGEMGERPTHPELLDWLATEFVERGWSVKEMHRLLMSSSTYQMSSRLDSDENVASDPDNRYLWRMRRRRLEAEALWDSVHAAAGTLNLAMGGRPVVPPLAEDEIAALRERWHWPVSAGPAQHTRRGMYILVRRNFRFPMFEVFDAPVTSVSCPARDVTTVAPQALWSLNNRSVFQQAQHFADRVVKEVGDDPASWVQRAWQIALARAPTAEETAEALQLMDTLAKSAAEGDPDDSAAADLESPPEALAALPPHQAAALVKLCLGIYNLNEFTFAD